jgi:hypothetical protein
LEQEAGSPAQFQRICEGGSCHLFHYLQLSSDFTPSSGCPVPRFGTNQRKLDRCPVLDTLVVGGVMANCRKRRRASSPPRQQGGMTGQRCLPVFQPVNMSYIHGEMHVPDQPPTASPGWPDIRGRQLDSYPSDLSTNPSWYYQNYASEPSSGSTSELGAERAVSFCTPSTPSSSNQGEPQEISGDTQLCDLPSPSDYEGALRGIGSSSRKSI